MQDNPQTLNIDSNDSENAPSVPTLKEAFWYWLKLGFISFGGPGGANAMMHQDLVEKKRWIQKGVFCMRLIIAWCYPDRKHNNWQSISAG